MIHINLLDINVSSVFSEEYRLIRLFISEFLLTFFGSNIFAKGFIFIAKR